MKKMSIRWKLLGTVASCVVLAGVLSSTLTSCGKKDDGGKPNEYIPDEIVKDDIKRSEENFYSQVYKKLIQYNELSPDAAKEKALGAVKALEEKVTTYEKTVDDYVKSKDFQKLDKQQQADFKSQISTSKIGIVKDEEKKLGIDSFDSTLIKYEYEKMTTDGKGMDKKTAEKIEQVINNFDSNHSDEVYSELEGTQLLLRDVEQTANLSQHDLLTVEMNVLLSWLASNINERLQMKDCSWQMYQNLKNLYLGDHDQEINKQLYSLFFNYRYPAYYTYAPGSTNLMDEGKNMDHSSTGHYTQQEVNNAPEFNLDDLATDNPLLFWSTFGDHTSDPVFTNKIVKHLGEILPGYFLWIKFTSFDWTNSSKISIHYNFGVSRYLGGDYSDRSSYTETYWYQNEPTSTNSNTPFIFTSNIGNSIPVNETQSILFDLASSQYVFSQNNEWNKSNTDVWMHYLSGSVETVDDQSELDDYSSWDNGSTAPGLSLRYSRSESKRPTWTQVDPEIWQVIERTYNPSWAQTGSEHIEEWKQNIVNDLGSTPLYLDSDNPMLNGLPRPTVYSSYAFQQYWDLGKQYNDSVQQNNYNYSVYNGLKLVARVMNITPSLSVLGESVTETYHAIKIQWCIMKDGNLVLTPDDYSNVGGPNCIKNGLYPLRFHINNDPNMGSGNNSTEWKSCWVTYHFDQDAFNSLRAGGRRFASVLLQSYEYNKEVDAMKGNATSRSTTSDYLDALDAKIVAGSVCLGLEIACAAAAVACSIINMVAYIATLGLGVSFLVMFGLCILQVGVSVYALTTRGILLTDEVKKKSNVQAIIDHAAKFSFVSTFLATHSLSELRTDYDTLYSSPNYGMVTPLAQEYNDYLLDNESSIKSSVENAWESLTGAEGELTADLRSVLHEMVSDIENFEGLLPQMMAESVTPAIVINGFVQAISTFSIAIVSQMGYAVPVVSIGIEAAAAQVAATADAWASAQADLIVAMQNFHYANEAVQEFANSAAGIANPELVNQVDDMVLAPAIDARDAAVNAVESAESAARKAAEDLSAATKAEEGAAPATSTAVPIVVIIVIGAIAIIVGIIDAILLSVL